MQRSSYKGIFKLPPGTILTLKKGGSREPVIIPYWSAKSVAEAGVSRPFLGTEGEAVAELEQLLHKSVAGQMVTDVPIGTFLSGGVDSSTVVALMQAQSSQPVKTFSIGFHENDYNEATHAKAVAQHLGTEHTELYMTPYEAMDVIPRLPMIYDEPFADASQVPTFLVAQLARQRVTVALTGDGGDELFGGYDRYSWASSIWRKTRDQHWLRRGFAALVLKMLSPEGWNRFYHSVSSLLPQPFQLIEPGDMAHKQASILGAENFEGFYRNLVSHWGSPESIVIGASELPTVLVDSARWANLPDLEERLMFLDAVTYLPEILLVKVDRAAMAVSLETRMPFLDRQVVEFAWRLPLSMKIRNGHSKWILRQVLYKHVPRELIERPKMGFGMPIDNWLRGPLRDWAETLLAEDRLRQEGFFHPGCIRRKWRMHLAGVSGWVEHLWSALMFQAWLGAQGKR